MSFRILLLLILILNFGCGVKSPPRSIQDDSIQNYISSYTDQSVVESNDKEDLKKKK